VLNSADAHTALSEDGAAISADDVGRMSGYASKIRQVCSAETNPMTGRGRMQLD